MIKIFNANDTDFSTNGNIVINPRKCLETKKKSLNGWYIEVEIDIKYKEYIEQDKLCVVKTKSKVNPQAFRINNITKSSRTISFTANHVMFDAENYFLFDVRPTDRNGQNTLSYINERTDKTSPFTVYSNVTKIDTAYFIRKNLLEAWTTIEERWGGVFDADNWNISFLNKVGNDNGEVVSYKKNMQGIQIFEDWSNVVTRIYPVGYDEILLPEKFLDSEVQYDKPYTKTIEFDTELEDEERTEANLISELRTNAQKYLEKNQYPQVSYEITSNINQDMEIGDTIHVKHPLVTLLTEVQEYQHNIKTGKIETLVFGNYVRDVKQKFNNIKESVTQISNKLSAQESAIIAQTNLINTLNKLGYVYIDENEILILDKIPREEAENVWRFGLGGIGFSSNGYEGPFDIAMTMDGRINADFITTGTLDASLITTGVLKSANYKSGSTGMSINLENGVIDTAKFKVSANGTITATGGTIGGFTIGSTYLANGTTSLGGASSSVYVGKNGISCGTAFKVTNAGAITASSGTIGGFSLGSTAFTGTLSGKYDYTYFDANIAASMIMEALYTSSSLVDILDIDNNGEVRATDYARIKSIVEGDLENTTNFSGTFQINSKNPRSCLVIKKGNEEVIALGIGGVQSKMVTTENFVCGYVTASSTSSFKGVAINGRTPQISFMEGNNIGTSITSTAVNSANFGKPSLAELKKNIVRIQKDALELIQNSDIYEYNYKTEKNGDKKHYGFVIGEEYKTPDEVLSKDKKAINIDNIAAIAWRGIQQIIEKLNSIEQKIKVLEGSE